MWVPLLLFQPPSGRELEAALEGTDLLLSW